MSSVEKEAELVPVVIFSGDVDEELSLEEPTLGSSLVFYTLSASAFFLSSFSPGHNTHKCSKEDVCEWQRSHILEPVWPSRDIFRGSDEEEKRKPFQEGIRHLSPRYHGYSFRVFHRWSSATVDLGALHWPFDWTASTKRCQHNCCS